MAKSPNSKSNPHPFLCCFGFSGKHRRFKPLKPAAAHRKGPISWMRFHSKQPPPSPSVQFNLSNTDSDRLSSKSISPTAAFNSNEDFTVAVPVATNRAGGEIVTRPENVKNDILPEKIIRENCEQLNSPKKLSARSESRFSFTRKLESFRSGRFAQPVSPTTKKNLKSTNLQSPTISLNLPRINQVKESMASMQVRLKPNNSEMKQRYRSMAGMSILMITLVIMIVWGRLCAILCTAAWIVMVTSLRSIVEDYDTLQFFKSDSYSEGFKKKLVVLKGFLCRNQTQNRSKKF
ncbi:uncharacterized protein LOC111488090 [Cucurbita maxima]|uniref:Uncharacterized protein LOC111488090 n=1 Tax=Cucurbita maxima TaxID=3661 RepID=A0A6J1JV00_CUCMA|nr:uncharacterized protein LOC111488090 [Cucurbita maxima]